jgi:AcrR family transcriptional regulator
MAYEVTKRINGRDYRYRVEGYRDPDTGRNRTRWHYLGRVLEDGVVVAARSPRSERASREKIVAATAELLEARDASRVTVSVIARHAGISPATFYRYFADRKSAFTAALTHLADRTLGEMTLDGPLGTREEEARRVSDWLDGLHRALLRRRAFRWSFAAIDRSKAKGRIERSLLKHDATAMLTGYLQRLHDAGLARIGDPGRLAESIMNISAAFIHFTANDEQNPERRGLRVTSAFPVIERAIFGP